MTAEELIKQIDENIEKPFITARFGDNWKSHTKRMLEEGQIDIDSIINIAWRQGRRALKFENVIQQLMR